MAIHAKSVKAHDRDGSPRPDKSGLAMTKSGFQPVSKKTIPMKKSGLFFHPDQASSKTFSFFPNAPFPASRISVTATPSTSSIATTHAADAPGCAPHVPIW